MKGLVGGLGPGPPCLPLKSVPDEDASVLSATSRACRASGIWRTTRHTDKRAALHAAADRRPTNQVSAWQAGWRRHSRHARHPHENRTDSITIFRAMVYIFICTSHAVKWSVDRVNLWLAFLTTTAKMTLKAAISWRKQ